MDQQKTKDEKTLLSSILQLERKYENSNFVKHQLTICVSYNSAKILCDISKCPNTYWLHV